MSDLISRKAAIDAIRASTSKYTGFMEMEMYTDDDAVEAIEDLPSAQPERKRGKWIDDGDPFMWECGCCGYRVKRYNNTRYCPNCGADMRGEQDDEQRSN